MSDQNKPAQDRKKSKRWSRGCGGCLGVVVIVLLAYYGLYFLLRGLVTSNPELIAHRGGPVYQPENTLAAFRFAIENGVDWIEFDVQRTSDGVLVVFHDETVERTTNGTGKVVDLTLEQFQALDAGDGERVPTFVEVIALAKDAGVGIMPEVKSPYLYPGIEAEIVAALDEEGYADQTVLQSFDPQSLIKAHEINPDLETCALYGLWQFNLSGPEPADGVIVCPMAEMVILKPWMIREAHQEGKTVYVWFGIIENPLVMRALLAMGADGLMVDDPIALVEVLDR
jgi:glycerophosphoryl diester phosphodiesterase